MDGFISENNYNMKILHNNHYAYGKYGICGTRGWVSINGEKRRKQKYFEKRSSKDWKFL